MGVHALWARARTKTGAAGLRCAPPCLGVHGGGTQLLLGVGVLGGVAPRMIDPLPWRKRLAFFYGFWFCVVFWFPWLPPRALALVHCCATVVA